MVSNQENLQWQSKFTGLNLWMPRCVFKCLNEQNIHQAQDKETGSPPSLKILSDKLNTIESKMEDINSKMQTKARNQRH